MRLGFLLVGLIFFLPLSTVQATDLAGNWSGHCGPLSATFCPCDADHYRVTFTGKFFKVIPFKYTVTLAVSGRDGDKIFLTGEQNLGPLFGSFSYNAEATATDFTAHFCARRYQGDFILKRCCP